MSIRLKYCCLLPVMDTLYLVLQFLLQHRVDVERLVLSSQEQILAIFAQRAKLINGRYHVLVERGKGKEELWRLLEQVVGDGASLMMVHSISTSEEDVPAVGGEGGREGGKERTLISKCYSKISVSSNSRTMDQ